MALLSLASVLNPLGAILDLAGGASEIRMNSATISAKCADTEPHLAWLDLNPMVLVITEDGWGIWGWIPRRVSGC